MLHILLTTLKVIGILLGLMLGLIVTLLLIVLFVPIRYKGNIKNSDIVAKITWLFHLLSISFEYKEQKLKYVIKILGITINKDKKKKQKNVTSKKKTEETKNSNDKNTTENVNVSKTPKKSASFAEKEGSHKDNIGKSVKPEKRNSISQKLSEVINNIKFKIRNICDKIINIKNKISDYKEFLTTDDAKNNIKSIFKIVFELIIYILPTKIKGYIKFGFDNPETTGKALGVISMFYGLYGGKLELWPDFENKVFEADVSFKGRIRFYRFLIVAFKLWRNEWLKKLMKFVKTH